MAVSRLPNGRWRSQVYHQGKTFSAAKVLGLPPEQATFSSRRKAEDAVAQARRVLAARSSSEVTVREWAHVWLSDPFWARRKESTNRQRERRVGRILDRYGDLPLASFGDRQVGEILRGPLEVQQTVRSMFRDAMSIEAGRLVERDPFLGVKFKKAGGEDHVNPPEQSVVWEMVSAARELVNPGFAAWLQVAAFTGMRPGELDALRWERVDWERDRIRVVEQFSKVTSSFTLPKNNRKRDALLTPPAREALEGLHRGSEFCFTNLRGGHWRESARAHHWARVREAVGYEGTLYRATRHFCGSYLANVLKVQDSEGAIALGHEDGGKLFRETYGHRDKDRVLDDVLAAYKSVGNIVELRPVGGVREEQQA